MTPDPSTQSSVVVPPALQEKHPELIALILGSESMNDEERQYWVNILPVMTEDQVENLRQILKNEKDQLAAIDAKYSKEMEQIGLQQSAEEMGQKRRAKREARETQEEGHREQEMQKGEDILRAIEGL